VVQIYDLTVNEPDASTREDRHQRLLVCIDRLAERMERDQQPGPELAPASYVDWLMRMRAAIAATPWEESGAEARRRIHEALICGGDHTPLERAWTRDRQDPDGRALLEEIEALTPDQMYSCPCCSCLTMSAKPPGSWCRCAVCGWEDDGNVMDGGGPNPPMAVARAAYESRGDNIPPHLRAPRPEELPS
jgi:Cysteine-rich CPCC